MRIDNDNFSEINGRRTTEPRFVFEVSFDNAGTDVIYLTSNTVSGLSGSNVFAGSLTASISGTSQRIDPLKAVATIGAISFTALDLGLTEVIKQKLGDGKGLKGKRVRFYVGDASLEWNDFILAQTQIVQDISYEKGAYKFRCADIQREMRKEIFDLKTTTLAATLEPGATAVQVYDTSQFEMVKHPESTSGRTDAPGQKVGYIRVESNGAFEIIRYTGKTATSFTGCTRGVLGTQPLRVELNSGATQDNAPKVTEYVYLEMPAPQLAYALLTGYIYGEAGETLPAHWHMGIPPQYIRTSDFVNIGPDLWNLSNNDAGLIARIEGVKKTDGKKFFEEQLLRMMACYSPIYSDGQIGLRRQTVIPSVGSYDAVITDDSVVTMSELKHDMDSVINRMTIRWNWSELKGGYTRTNVLIDGQSIEEHGVSEVRDIELRALSGSQHSYETLKSIFDGLRDRYAGPPLRLTLTLTPPYNVLEVGDIVRVRLSHIKDFTGSGQDGALDRNFEVQQVKTDWVTGRVTVELFGSSQPASALPPDEIGTPVSSGFFSKGTLIAPANFPGAVIVSGGVTRIVQNITLAGHDNVNNPSAVYSCPGDLTIDAGVTVKTTKNVQLRINGFFQINGTIDAVGGGADGGLPPAQRPEEPPYIWPETAKGVAGFYGSTIGQAGWRLSDTGFSSSLANYHRQKPMEGTRGDLTPVKEAPELRLVTLDDDIQGLPSTLIGSGGCAGNSIFGRSDLFPPDGLIARGGAGGKGGGGLAIICNGAEFGATGKIDTSGSPGALPESYSEWGRTFHAGRGAGGAPGAVYWILLNPTSNAPTLAGKTFAYYGSGDASSYSTVISYEDYDAALGTTKQRVKVLPSGNLSWALPLRNGGLSTSPDFTSNMYQSVHKFQFLTGIMEPVPDAPATAEQPVAVVLQEAVNTPRSAAANLSTIEVSVMPPADSNYSYSWIRYREQGQPGWFDVGPASPEALIVVASDGKTYEVQALSVSKSGVRAESGPVAEITTTNVTRPNNPAEEPVIKIPDVHGLELFEQGHDTEFTGRDAKFSWRKTSITEWFEIGSEPQGASSGALDLYFRDYQVEIWAENQVVRTEWVVDNHYTYTYEKNAEDYQRVKGKVGAWREFAVRVSCRGRLNQLSKAPAVLNVSNPAPELPTNLTVSAGFKVAMVDFDPPADLDYKETRVYLSTESGFTPDDSNRVAVTVGGPITLQKLDDGTTYYLRVQPFDAFGPGPLSSEFAVTTQELDADDINGLSPWATVTEADREFIEEHLADNSIPSTKIEKLVASKIVTGTLAATEKISVEGQIESISGPYAAVLGPKALGGKAALLSFTNSGIPIFALYEDGTASYKGSIEITGGTGYSKLTDKPSSLSDISAAEAQTLTTAASTASTAKQMAEDAASAASTAQSTAEAAAKTAEWDQVTGTGKPADNATVGAQWGVNLGNIPARFGDNNTPTTPGLYLTADYMGYHNGNGQISGWGAYIQKDGQFHFGGVGNNYIDWDGSLLSVVGNVQTSDGDNAENQRIVLNSTLNQLELWGNNGVVDGALIATLGKTETYAGARAILSIQTWDTETTCAYFSNRGAFPSHALEVEGTASVEGQSEGNLFTVRGSATNPMVDIVQHGRGDAMRIESRGTADASGRCLVAISDHEDAALFRTNGQYNFGVWAIGTRAGIYAEGGDWGVQGTARNGVRGLSLGVDGIGVEGFAQGTGGVGVRGWGSSKDFYATGPGTNYAPFTGSHDALIKLSTPANPLPPLEEGDILRVIRIAARGSLSNIIPEVEVCTESHSKAVYGIMTVSEGLPESVENGPVAMRGLSQEEYELFGAEYCWATVNALGEGQINVCDENGDFEVGDFICTSNLPGKGMRYDGHDMRVVVAKIMEPVTWADVEPDEFGNKTKKVACIYMCG